MKSQALRMTPAALAAAAKGDLSNALVAATPGGIEGQEKAGQQALVASTDMPKKLDRTAFEAVGFTFGEDVDELFMKATLPPGWTRAATGHSMHSDVLDARGRKRVSVFYKAAFYDRRADAYLLPRYRVERDYDLPGDDLAYVVRDAGTEIYRTITTKRASYKDEDAHEQTAKKWLLEAVPNAFDPSAWD